MKHRIMVAVLVVACFPMGELSAKTSKYRLIWREDPKTTATVAWDRETGTNAVVHYGDKDKGSNWEKYPQQQSVDVTISHKGLNSQFSHLKGLKPDSEYYFVIKDSDSVSPRFWFRTASAKNRPFTFIAGGDSRTHQEQRRRANLMVSRLRPLFVAFAGDMTDRATPAQWDKWFDDWQLTTGEDGRMTPIVVARGNHEPKGDVLKLFCPPHEDVYYSMDFGKELLHLVTLNSEIEVGGKQQEWLESDLKQNNSKWTIVQYHKPIRPHTAHKKENNNEYAAWAGAFYLNGVDLGIECDSHMVKRTWPVRPSFGEKNEAQFERDDEFGIVFTGEGCWGAPTRPNNDDKSWTRASGSFGALDWILVSKKELIVRTVKYDNVDSVSMVDKDSSFSLPSNIELWTPETGADVVIVPKSRPPAGALDEWSVDLEKWNQK